jgi:hypothetical protein
MQGNDGDELRADIGASGAIVRVADPGGVSVQLHGQAVTAPKHAYDFCQARASG